MRRCMATSCGCSRGRATTTCAASTAWTCCDTGETSCSFLILRSPKSCLDGAHGVDADYTLIVLQCINNGQHLLHHLPQISPYCHVAQADCIPLWVVELGCHPLPNPPNCMRRSDDKQIPKTRRLQEAAIDTGLGLLTSCVIVEFVLGKHASKAAVALQVGRADGGWRSSERHTLPPQPQCNAGRPQTRCCRYGPAPL